MGPWFDNINVHMRHRRVHSLSLHVYTEERLCEDAVKSWPSESQEEGSHQEANPAKHWSETLTLQNYKKITFSYLSHAACMVFFFFMAAQVD